MHGNFTRENRDTPSTPDTTQCMGRLEKAMGHKSSTNEGGESDGRVLPAKHSNKDEKSSAESVEGRGPHAGDRAGSMRRAGCTAEA
jgi:hypothetical protein